MGCDAVMGLYRASRGATVGNPVGHVSPKKTGPRGPVSEKILGLLGSQGFDHLVQTAFVPGRLVLVDDALVDHAVDDRHGSFVGV